MEILNYADQDSLRSLVHSTGPVAGIDIEQVNQEKIVFPVRDIDLVIMNPPFTNNAKRGSRYSEEVKQKMQQHEQRIRDNVLQSDSKAGELIDANSISTFFTPLADRILSPNKGVLAKVIPATACTGASGLPERIFLADRFHIERIITSHDPKHANFSENTSIHESLLIARRQNNQTRHQPTEFIALKKMPQNPSDIDTIVHFIENYKDNEYLNRSLWPVDRIQAGDWSPVQWCNGELAEIAWALNNHDNLEAAGVRCRIGPAGQAINGAYQRCDRNAPGARKVFHSISSKIRQTMIAEPEDWQCPKPDKGSPANNLWRQRSNVLVAVRFCTTINSISSLWSDTPSVGNGFVPLSVDDESQGKALVAWWNSTPAMIMLLNLRSKKLTYPKWSLAQLRSVKIPKSSSPSWPLLMEAFEKHKAQSLLPLKQANQCSARESIDAVAAQILGIPEETVADWRKILSLEPTISG